MKGSKRVPRKIRERADEIMGRLRAGATVAEVKGKRLRHDRDLISIPIGRRWRLTVRVTDDGYVARKIQSHEDYNRTKPGT